MEPTDWEPKPRLTSGKEKDYSKYFIGRGKGRKEKRSCDNSLEWIQNGWHTLEWESKHPLKIYLKKGPNERREELQNILHMTSSESYLSHTWTLLPKKAQFTEVHQMVQSSFLCLYLVYAKTNKPLKSHWFAFALHIVLS